MRRPSMTAYKPTVRDMVARQALNLFGDTYANRNLARNFFGSSGLGSTGEMSVADFTPAGVGFAADEAGRLAGQGHPLQAAVNLGLAVVPIPGAKGLGKKAVAKTAEELMQRAAARGVDLSLQQGSRGLTLSKIVVPKAARGQGVGSQVMDDVLSFADANGVKVMLTPDASFGGSVPRLKQFYGRFGFEPNTGRSRDLSISESMVRQPAQQPNMFRGRE
jgi:GNAT superfamily N-acetyltransferase